MRSEADGEGDVEEPSWRRRQLGGSRRGDRPTRWELVFANRKLAGARSETRYRRLESSVGAMEAVLSGFEFICCMSARTKSAEQREYAHLRDALARKQAEVAKLQEQCDALRRDGDAHTERYGAQYLQNASGTEETEEYTEDENAPPDAVARR